MSLNVTANVNISAPALNKALSHQQLQSSLSQLDLNSLGVTAQSYGALSTPVKSVVGNILKKIDSFVDKSVHAGIMTQAQANQLQNGLAPLVAKAAQGLQNQPANPFLPPIGGGYGSVASNLVSKSQFGQLGQLAAGGSSSVGALLAAIVGIQALTNVALGGSPFGGGQHQRSAGGFGAAGNPLMAPIIGAMQPAIAQALKGIAPGAGSSPSSGPSASFNLNINIP